MKSLLNAEQIRVLAQLGATEAKTGGGLPVPERVAQGLLRNRLATPDEYGNMKITERGAQDLVQLKRRGLVRRTGPATRAAPSSPFRRRS